MVLAPTLLACLAGSAGAASVSVAHETKRVIGGHEQLDRMQWFNVHSQPGGINWRDQDTQDFTAMGAHLGRSFVLSASMMSAKEDASKPGFVDKQSLIDHCKQNPSSPGNWPEQDIEMVYSSRPEQLFANSCDGPDGKRPSGFVPGSAEAIADFYGAFREHCMMPTQSERFIFEVANEIDVKVGDSRCSNTIEDMLKIHQAAADVLHASSGKKALVCGPTGAYPAFEAHDFGKFHETFAPFIEEPRLDCLSMHYYDTYLDNQDVSQLGLRSGANLDALLDLQEAYSVSTRGHVMPLLASEYGSDFKVKPLDYSPLHDFLILRGVNSKLMQFLDRPDRVLKAIPFIVDKSTWYDAGPGAKQSYPFALWRNPSGDKQTWEPTHLHKFYEIWSEVRGTQVLASSDDINLQVQAFLASDSDSSTLFVALNSLHSEPLDVDLSWAQLGSDSAGTLSRLYLDHDTQTPKHDQQDFGSVPATLTMHPEELSILKIKLPKTAPSGAIHEVTLYSRKTMQPLTQRMESWQVEGSVAGAQSGHLRVGLSCSASNLPGVLKGLNVSVAGKEVTATPRTKVYKSDVFMGTVEIALDASLLQSLSKGSLQVELMSEAPADAVVSSVVLVVQTEPQLLVV